MHNVLLRNKNLGQADTVTKIGRDECYKENAGTLYCTI